MLFNFVAVNYNGADFTIDFLRSIKNLIRDDDDIVRVVIVDNDSLLSDRSKLEAFIKDDETVTLIHLDNNIGYFGGLNAGLEVLVNTEYSYTIVGNNDLMFGLDFLDELKKYNSIKSVMVLAPDVITLDGRHQNPLARVRLSTWHKVRTDLYFINYYVTQFVRTFIRYFKHMKYYANKMLSVKPHPAQISTEIEIIKLGIGACYVLLPSYFFQFTKLDDSVFLWGEEVLLAHQLESAGGSILYYPKLKVMHCESASVNHIQSRKRYEMVKTSYKIYRKYL